VPPLPEPRWLDAMTAGLAGGVLMAAALAWTTGLGWAAALASVLLGMGLLCGMWLVWGDDEEEQDDDDGE
jgi:hypothetical protein